MALLQAFAAFIASLVLVSMWGVFVALPLVTALLTFVLVSAIRRAKAILQDAKAIDKELTSRVETLANSVSKLSARVSEIERSNRALRALVDAQRASVVLLAPEIDIARSASSAVTVAGALDTGPAQPTLPASGKSMAEPQAAVVQPAALPVTVQSVFRPAAATSVLDLLKQGLDLEERLGTNWLNKLGVFMLVMGVAFFLAYQLRELGPAGKVVVGYVVGAGLLIGGVLLERRDRYRIPAGALIAGGWGLLFFTTYAMYNVPAARVLESESVDLVLLLVVAAAMVGHSLHYRSQVVTGLAFLLAFATVAISHVSVFSLTAGALLALALIVIVDRQQWFEMEVAGIAATYLNHYLWLRPIIEPMGARRRPFPEFWARYCCSRSSAIRRHAPSWRSGGFWPWAAWKRAWRSLRAHGDESHSWCSPPSGLHC